jgi:hypothetical protein
LSGCTELQRRDGQLSGSTYGPPETTRGIKVRLRFRYASATPPLRLCLRYTSATPPLRLRLRYASVPQQARRIGVIGLCPRDTVSHGHLRHRTRSACPRPARAGDGELGSPPDYRRPAGRMAELLATRVGAYRYGTVTERARGPVGAPLRIGDADSEDRRGPSRESAPRRGKAEFWAFWPGRHWPGSDGRDPRSREVRPARRRGRPGWPDARYTGPRTCGHRQALSRAGRSGSWQDMSSGTQEHSGSPSHHAQPAVTGEAPPLSEPVARLESRPARRAGRPWSVPTPALRPSCSGTHRTRVWPRGRKARAVAVGKGAGRAVLKSSKRPHRQEQTGQVQGPYVHRQVQ